MRQDELEAWKWLIITNSWSNKKTKNILYREQH